MKLPDTAVLQVDVQGVDEARAKLLDLTAMLDEIEPRIAALAGAMVRPIIGYRKMIVSLAGLAAALAGLLIEPTASAYYVVVGTVTSGFCAADLYAERRRNA